MLSHPESNRKQEIIHQCFLLPQPQKRDSCDSCDSFQRLPPTSLSLEVTYNIYKYIYNKLNIIITI